MYLRGKAINPGEVLWGENSFMSLFYVLHICDNHLCSSSSCLFKRMAGFVKSFWQVLSFTGKLLLICTLGPGQKYYCTVMTVTKKRFMRSRTVTGVDQAISGQMRELKKKKTKLHFTLLFVSTNLTTRTSKETCFTGEHLRSGVINLVNQRRSGQARNGSLAITDMCKGRAVKGRLHCYRRLRMPTIGDC